MPRSGPAASTKGRAPGEAQGWQQELTAVSQLAQTLQTRCHSGTPWQDEAPDADAPAAATSLPFPWHGGVRAGQQPPVAGCQGAGGALWAATWVGCHSAEVPHSLPCSNQCVARAGIHPSTNPSCPTSEPLWRGGCCASPSAGANQPALH